MPDDGVPEFFFERALREAAVRADGDHDFDIVRGGLPAARAPKCGATRHGDDSDESPTTRIDGTLAV